MGAWRGQRQRPRSGVDRAGSLDSVAPSLRFLCGWCSMARNMLSNGASHVTESGAVETRLSSGTAASKRRWRIGFFTVMPGVILLLVVAGFTRTLFARPLFRPAPIPPYL